MKVSDIDHYSQGVPLFSIAAKNARFINSERTWAKKFRFGTRERRSNEASHMGNNLPTGTFDGRFNYFII